MLFSQCELFIIGVIQWKRDSKFSCSSQLADSMMQTNWVKSRRNYHQGLGGERWLLWKAVNLHWVVNVSHLCKIWNCKSCHYLYKIGLAVPNVSPLTLIAPLSMSPQKTKTRRVKGQRYPCEIDKQISKVYRWKCLSKKKFCIIGIMLQPSLLGVLFILS